MKDVIQVTACLLWGFVLFSLSWPDTYGSQQTDRFLAWQLEARIGIIVFALIPITFWIILFVRKTVKKRLSRT